MKILAINGSPKGDYSVTLQTYEYLEKLYADHEFKVINAGQSIKAIERDFSKARPLLEEAELIIFVYPVYTFIAPYQLHRFIELIKENGVDLKGKFCTQITTSKHFYDVTAHKYVEENALDMGMKYIGGLSADMEDLLNEKGRKEAREFFRYVNFSIENNLYERESSVDCDFTPKAVTEFENNLPKEGDVVIITNCEETDLQLKSMIARFRNKLNRKSRIVNIREYQFKGGCLGCFNCAVSGKCIYKDGFDEFLRNEIQKGEAMVYAYSIKDHSMGASFKLYDDRQFCNGHRTVTMGMPVGYLVSGKLSTEQNLKMIMEARANVGTNFLAGIASDEFDPDTEIDNLALNLNYAIENKYVPPQNFYGIGGMKIFRDLIWLMQGMMKADHKFYKKYKQYDFPQKKRGRMMAMYLVGAMLSSDKIKSKMGNKMNEGMLMPYKKELEKLNRK
ncbi:MAG: NAD(P)H-dependent oxidoreductase [Ruminococcaceae bacterium]|nr:NAD(P)H-dependent oxidoreductase [Oscillospiraceae bacterium]